jgi:putative NADPH-quinone reductase
MTRICAQRIDFDQTQIVASTMVRTRPWPALLNGNSARIIVTMGMPAWIYRWYFLAHSLKSLERNILRFSGIIPVHETLIGGVEAGGPPTRNRWLETVRALGTAGK